MQRRLEVETPEAVAFAYPLAGMGSRGLAVLLDSLILLAIILAELVAGILLVAGIARFTGDAPDLLSPWAIGVLIAVVFVTYWGYYIFGEVFRNGRTPGKRIMRLRVVRLDGGRVGVLESVIRNVLRILDLMPTFYGVALISALASRRAQRLGDMAAGTVVIEEPPDLASLGLDASGELASLVGDYLSRRGGITPEARWQAGVALLAAFGEEPLPDWDEPVVAGRLVQLADVRESA